MMRRSTPKPFRTPFNPRDTQPVSPEEMAKIHRFPTYPDLENLDGEHLDGDDIPNDAA
jgi:hypothetical protein